MKRSLLLMAMCFSATFALAGEPSTEGEASVDKEEQLHKSLGNWYLVDPAWDYQNRVLIDTDPSSRPVLQRFMVDRAGISASEASRADRLHLEFSPGSTSIGSEQKQKLTRFVSTIQKGDRVYVLGFTDTKGGEHSNRQLAAKRGERVSEVVSSSQDSHGFTLHQITGPGWLTGDGGRRAEIWVLSTAKR